MTGSDRSHSANAFSAVKVFSATTISDRVALGDRITSWLSAQSGICVVDQSVVQSSDESFHCLSIVLFYAG